MKTINISEEVQKARVNNYLDLVLSEFETICYERKNNISAMLDICNGDWLMEAMDNVALQIQSGKFDNMLIPKENNK